MDCYLCHNSFPTLDILLRHIKLDHGAPSISNFKCTACKPSAQFKNVYRFKRHVESRHSALFERPGTPIETHEELNNNEASSIPEERCFQRETAQETLSDPDSSEEKLEKTSCRDEEILDIRSKLREAFLTFTMNLYSKKNLSRKDVTELQHNITEDIVMPIINTLSKIACIPDDPKYLDLVNDIRDPFQNKDLIVSFKTLILERLLKS